VLLVWDDFLPRIEAETRRWDPFVKLYHMFGKNARGSRIEKRTAVPSFFDASEVGLPSLARQDLSDLVGQFL
jgi:hypothetical protein